MQIYTCKQSNHKVLNLLFAPKMFFVLQLNTFHNSHIKKLYRDKIENLRDC